MNNVVFIFFVLLFSNPQQINKDNYVLEILLNKDVVKHDYIDAILPNADLVKVPVLNNLIPVIYIHTLNEDSKKLVCDYNDKDCLLYTNQKFILFSKNKIIENKIQTKNNEESFLERFSLIQNEINKLKTLNKHIESNDAIKGFSKNIEELKAMLLDINKKNEVLMQCIEKSQTKEEYKEIKSMISNIRIELKSIQETINLKFQKKEDILNPSLPIIDKELVPSENN